VAAYPAGFFDESVVQCEVGRHVYKFTHKNVYVKWTGQDAKRRTALSLNLKRALHRSADRDLLWLL
jgi:hypothetical protein